MELEGKLDEDFLFYIGFAHAFLKRITDPEVSNQAKLWLRKLIGRQFKGIEKKRCRNIYLSHLLVCMQNTVLEGPFLLHPRDVDIRNAYQVFEPIGNDIEPPAWLNEKDDIPVSDGNNMKEGRTYIATRTLPFGQGAFAYIAISMGDEEPKWIGGGEGVLQQKLSDKYRDMVPPVHEMEKILARRKDPKEREKVLTFYDVLLQNISDELDEIITTEENETVNGLVEQLIQDLKNKEQYEQYEEMEEAERRTELLMVLHARVKSRRDKIAKREEVLDEIEQKLMPQSFFDDSVTAEDKFELPPAMWEQAMNKYPKKRNIEKMREHYPISLIDKFCQLLGDQKEAIALNMHRRHENMISQMKKEMRKEGEKGNVRVREAKAAAEQACAVLVAVKEAHKLQSDAIKKNDELKNVPLTEHSKMYEHMRAALFDTQKSVEEEAARGQILAAQINAVANQTDLYVQINDESIRTTEETNMAIMKNLRRLRGAIGQYESRISQIKLAAKSAKSTRKRDVLIF